MDYQRGDIYRRTTLAEAENGRHGKVAQKTYAKPEDKTSQLQRRPLGGRNSVDFGNAGGEYSLSKSNFNVTKKKDEVDGKLVGKKTLGKLLRKKTEKQAVFKVPLPKTVPKPVREASGELSKLSSAIDSMISEVPENVVKIDVPSLYTNAAYDPDIIDYLKAREMKLALDPYYFASPHVKGHQRGILVDWLTQVQAHAEVGTESLHLAVALLDQMLSKRQVELPKLQLIGTVCFFIASKVKERFPPEIDELLRLTENAYSRQEFKAAEREVLRTLKFDVHVPTAITFLDRGKQVTNWELELNIATKVEHMSRYILQSALTDNRLVTIVPSLRAGAALWMARRLLLPVDTSVWTASLAYYSGYQEEDLLPTCAKLAKLLLKAPGSKFQGARNKYSSRSRYGGISNDPCLQNTSLLQDVASSRV